MLSVKNKMVIRINPSPAIPALSRVNDKTKLNIRYSLIAPYANAHIHWDSKEKEIIYKIEEPKLDEEQKKILEKVESGMIELININVVIEKTTEAMIEYLDKTARLLLDELNLEINEEGYEKIFYYLYRDFVGLK